MCWPIVSTNIALVFAKPLISLNSHEFVCFLCLFWVTFLFLSSQLKQPLLTLQKHLEISPGVLKMFLLCDSDCCRPFVVALLAVTISFMSGCKSQLIMLLWCATFSTNVSLGCICGFSGRLTANIMSLQLGWILAYYKYIGIWKCCQTWIDIKTPVKMINQLS